MRKYKRGTIIEIMEKFGNGKENKVIGYYWRKKKNDNYIILTQTFPPNMFKGQIVDCRYVPFELIKEIKVLGE